MHTNPYQGLKHDDSAATVHAEHATMHTNPYQGLKHDDSAATVQAEHATMHTNPYQGLKPTANGAIALGAACYNAHESLSGIETVRKRR